MCVCGGGAQGCEGGECAWEYRVCVCGGYKESEYVRGESVRGRQRMCVCVRV